MSYNATMTTLPNLGRGLIGIPTRDGILNIPTALYNSLLGYVQAAYPDAPDITGMVLGVTVGQAIAANNPVRFFVWSDLETSIVKRANFIGKITAAYRTQNQVYAVVLDPAASTPVAGSTISVDPAKYLVTNAAGKVAISGMVFAAYDTGETVRTDSYGRKIALVEVL